MPIDDDRIFDSQIGKYLQDEFKALNAHIPRRRKTLAELLKEEHPQVELSDGSTHSFRKKELESIAAQLEEGETKSLLLPMLLEVSSGITDITIRSATGVEAKLLSKILNTDVLYRLNRVTLFKRHVGIIRRLLNTSTQYVFTP